LFIPAFSGFASPRLELVLAFLADPENHADVFHQKQIEELFETVGLYDLEGTNMLKICLDFRIWQL